MVSPTGVIATEWSLFALAVLLVSARVTMHIKLKNSNLHLSDTFLSLAVASALGLLICDSYTYKAGAMDEFAEPTVEIWKVRFATNYFFDFGVYLPKYSMLASYYRIIPRTAQQSRKALYAVTFIIAVCSMVTLFADTFWCGTDISINWSNAKSDCTVFTSMTLAKMNWALHFSCEIMLFVLPLPLINGLRLSQRREKAGILVVFLLGAITILVSTARFTAMMMLSNDIMIYILATAEFTIAIMILSLISLRPLLRRIGRAATAFTSPTPSRSRSNKASRSIAATFGSRPEKTRSFSLSKTPILNRDPYPTNRQSSSKGSDINLTEQDPGKIYKTEEVIVTYSNSNREFDADSEISRGLSSPDAEIRVNSMMV
ncbi:unnamed protein product [Periconia digitata]|uniref:Rhodopsin domain-containing protein n=1 Tax=Periconia digitata TaxID=1303443 RepID=A0A9W4UMZ9_9PLEO|nr:unnamed protein product [Periconia digitata]